MTKNDSGKVCTQKKPFTENHIKKAEKILLGKSIELRENVCSILTSANVDYEQLKKLRKIGFEVIEVNRNRKDVFSLIILLKWKKELNAILPEGVVV